jgi:hypothetical protein
MNPISGASSQAQRSQSMEQWARDVAKTQDGLRGIGFEREKGFFTRMADIMICTNLKLIFQCEFPFGFLEGYDYFVGELANRFLNWKNVVFGLQWSCFAAVFEWFVQRNS